MAVAHPLTRQLILAARGVAGVAFVATLAGGEQLGTRLTGMLVVLSLLTIVPASWLTSRAVSGPRRALFAGVAGLFAFALVRRAVVPIVGGATATAGTTLYWVFMLAGHVAFLTGVGVALAHRAERRDRREVLVDTLLLVAAAAVVALLLPQTPAAALAEKALGVRVGYTLWRLFTAASLVGVALVIGLRGELLGLRTGAAIAAGTGLFAVANAIRSQSVVTNGAPTAPIEPFSLAVMLSFAVALDPSAAAAPVSPDGFVSDELREARRRLRFLAFLGAACIGVTTTILLGILKERRLDLAVAVAALDVLLAVRTGLTFNRQLEEQRELAAGVAAEQELSTSLQELSHTLEHRVAERTAELAEAERVLRRMWTLGHQVALELDPDRVLHRFVEAVVDVAQADGGALALVQDARTLRVAAASGTALSLNDAVLPIEGSALGHVLRTGTVVRSIDPGGGGRPAAGQAPGGAMAVPLVRRAERIGALALYSRAPRRFTDEEVGRVRAMTDMLSVALANAELVSGLRLAEERYRTLFVAAPDTVIVSSGDGEIREANDLVRDLIGLDPSAAVGRSLGEFVVGPDRQLFLNALRGVAAGDPPCRLEVRLLPANATAALPAGLPAGGDRDGVAAGERVASVAISSVPGAAASALIIARDVTAEREMRSRLLDTERLAALGELVAGVAHEVNNPLGSISAYAQLLLRDGALSGDQREMVDVVHSEAVRASHVVRDLLAFARRAKPGREPVDLGVVVDRSLRLRTYQLSAAGVTAEVSLAQSLPPVMGDARQLQQVVLNLVTNSIQAMAAAGPRDDGKPRRLHVTTRTAGGRVELELSDTGPGVPSEVRARIFEPFFTTKPEGEGTGLGLSVSYGIVQAHGGYLELVRTGPQGTTFLVSFPAAGADTVARAGLGVSHPTDVGVPFEQILGAFAEGAGGTRGNGTDRGPAAFDDASFGGRGSGAPPAAPGGAGDMPTPRSPLAGLRVLFVDDEADARSAAQAFGQARGFTVLEAADGLEALRLVRTTGVDAVVCGVRMARMSGVEFHDVLRREQPGLARRMVFTAGGSPADVPQTPPAAARVPVVSKPLRFDDVERAVLNVVRGG